jgi:hypothetical protein
MLFLASDLGTHPASLPTMASGGDYGEGPSLDG